MAEASGNLSLKEFKAAQSEDESGTDAGEVDDALAKAIGGYKGVKPGKKHDPKTTAFNAKLEKLSNVGDDTHIDVALAKCSQMHSVISKQVIDIRKLGSVLKKGQVAGHWPQQRVGQRRGVLAEAS